MSFRVAAGQCAGWPRGQATGEATALMPRVNTDSVSCSNIVLKGKIKSKKIEVMTYVCFKDTKKPSRCSWICVIYSKKAGVAIMAQQTRIQLVSMRMWVRSLASLTGLGIYHCSDLWCRLQMRLRSGVAVTVVKASSCSSDSTPSLGTSICCGKKNQKKKKKKRQNHKASNMWVCVGGCDPRAGAFAVSVIFCLFKGEGYG